MEDVPQTTPRGSVGSTALGRLQLRVPEAGGHEEVVVERRWPDLSAARQWCERTIARAVAGTQVLEIQVFGETWWHARSWEDEQHRAVPEVLQLGLLDASGSVRWAEPRSMSPHVGDRLPL